MKIIDLEQGSPEWLSWRENHITSTDASVIMDLNPWCDKKTLQGRKLGFIDPIKENAAMRRGSELEPEARAIFIEKTGIVVEPAVGESEDHPYMGTSLDGISEDGNVIVEIKSPVRLNKHLAHLEQGVIIEPHYRCQIMHHLAVSGAECCFYVSYHPEDPDKVIIKEVMPDKEFIERMIEAERYFYEKNILLMEPIDERLFDEKR